MIRWLAWGACAVLSLVLLAARHEAALAAGPEGVHVLTEVEGQLLLMRPGWHDFVPASVGTELRHGDLLHLEPGSWATVACAGLGEEIKVAVPMGTRGVPCAPADRPLMTDSLVKVARTRGEPGVDYPILVSPRMTNVLGTRPTLRWTPVPGATVYEVTVIGSDLSWTRSIGPSTQLAYPEDARELTRGISYSAVVRAGDRTSEEERTPGTGFRVLPDDRQRQALELSERVWASGLPEPMVRFLLARAFADRDFQLYAEAIELLEPSARLIDRPHVSRLLGDLYLTVGLNELAEQSYLEALAQADRRGDQLSLGLAAEGLATAYEGLGLKPEAAAALEQAWAVFLALGDSRQADQLKARLDWLAATP